MSLLPPPRASSSALKRQKDSTGLPIPPNLLPAWERRQEVQELASHISVVRTFLRSYQQNKDALYSRVCFASAFAHMEQAAADILAAKPYAVCPVCGGNEEVRTACNLCKGIGLLSKFYWDSTVSEDLKKMRQIAVKKNL